MEGVTIASTATDNHKELIDELMRTYGQDLGILFKHMDIQWV
ncbi:hypothetical protein P4534_14185 [Peribacillus butanolivorans]|nr:hypothetical protein [Peribacillus butanolivorans]